MKTFSRFISEGLKPDIKNYLKKIKPSSTYEDVIMLSDHAMKMATKDEENRAEWIKISDELMDMADDYA